VFDVSIVRVGLAETKNFAQGYDAIFGGSKKEPQVMKSKARKPAKKAAAKRKPKAKKKSKARKR
jgi:hypothetical protein